MLIIFKIINAAAFAFVAYLLADVLAKALKSGSILKPVAITLCSITISYHLIMTDGEAYVLGAFIGFFMHTCANAYVKKKSSSKGAKDKLNP